MLPRLLPTLAGAALALALASSAAAPAQAATVTYDATIDADFTYVHTRHGESDGGGRDTVLDVGVNLHGNLRSTLPMVSFADGRMREYGTGASVSEDVYGTYDRTEADSWTGTSKLHCTALDQPSPFGRAGLDPAGLPGSFMNTVRVTDLLEVDGACDDGRAPGWTIARLDGDVDDPTGGPFDAVFEMPPAAIGQGKIVQLVEGGASGERCPGYVPSDTQSCALKWTATITFVRSDLVGTTGPVVENVPPPAPQPVPPAPPAPTGNPIVDQATKAIRDYLRQARMGAGNKSATLTVDCPGACAGTVRAQGARATFRAAGARRSAAGAGARRVVATLRFGPAARRAIARRGSVAVAVAMRLGGPQAPLQKATVTLKARR